MVEHIKSDYYLIIYFVILIVSIATYRNYFDTALKLFPIYIAYTLITELLGFFITTFEEFSFFEDAAYSWNNVVIYNLYSVLTFIFYCWLYYQVLRNRRYMKYIKWGGLGILLSYLVSSYYQDSLRTGLFYSELLASLFLLFMIGLYFKERRKPDKSIIEPFNLMFWVSTGLFIFHTFFPFLYTTGFLKPEIWIKYHFRDLLKALIVISYSFFLIGLIFGKRKAFN